MAAAGRAVAQTQHRVHVEAGLAVVADGDVAQEAQALALAVDLDRLISLLGEIEPADRRALEGAERRQRRAGEAGPCGEVGDGGEGLLAGVENEDEGPFAGVFPDELGLHDGLLMARSQLTARRIVAATKAQAQRDVVDQKIFKHLVGLTAAASRHERLRHILGATRTSKRRPSTLTYST